MCSKNKYGNEDFRDVPVFEPATDSGSKLLFTLRFCASPSAGMFALRFKEGSRIPLLTDNLPTLSAVPFTASSNRSTAHSWRFNRENGALQSVINPSPLQCVSTSLYRSAFVSSSTSSPRGMCSSKSGDCSRRPSDFNAKAVWLKPTFHYVTEMNPVKVASEKQCTEGSQRRDVPES